MVGDRLVAGIICWQRRMARGIPKRVRGINFYFSLSTTRRKSSSDSKAERGTEIETPVSGSKKMHSGLTVTTVNAAYRIVPLQFAVFIAT